MYRVIISNGVFRFHLVSAAVEATSRDVLGMFLTGAYPKGRLNDALKRWFPRSARAQRLVDRTDSGVRDRDVVSVWSAEVVIQSGVVLGRIVQSRSMNDWVQALGLSLYGHMASRAIHRVPSDIYHYRAGYGGRSIKIAKSQGMLCLCDHSVVSPLVLDHMINNEGRLPSTDALSSTPLSPMWKRVLSDIEAADHVLVNSELVKATLVHHDISAESITVIYQGVDRKFLDSVPRTAVPKTPRTLLFAGEISRRKGFDALIGALSAIPADEWNLVVAGGVNETTETAYRCFLTLPNVRHVGFVSREELAHLMSASVIFLLPTLAEGSARVVFEALACGCYVITTPNAGSIVEDGLHGALVQPGDAKGLSRAIADALHSPSRVVEIGAENGRLIREKYGQGEYGKQLDRLYQDLIEGSNNNPPRACRSRSIFTPKARDRVTSASGDVGRDNR